MKQRVRVETDPAPAVSLHIEAVPYRSAAWRELWRHIFLAIEEELDRLDRETADAGASDGSPTGGTQC